MELVFELNELVEELGVDVLNSFDTLVMNLIHEVFLRDLLPSLLCSMHSLKSFTFLKRGLVDILFLCQSEGEDAVEQSLEQLVKLFLLIAQKRFIDDIRHKLLLKDDQ